ncbi:DUF599 domain-containing protein [Piscinibacter terrae]|uniref:DUF599 domain-containing protein n=1 Tax=Piscinibacter terrae TaxID=2496871 RepID=A0A3N7JYS1_9BURK|nr:DUF599 domain-containing protein [Albitalea terrae]RQP25949.1 DUF599 domain-containing protein [Albitalea terrae]
MEAMFKVLALLPWLDWAAVVVFFSGWAGYAWFARHRAMTQPSVLASTNRIRQAWMLQTTYRDVRVIDGVVVQSLSTSPSFFASTSILVIGGLLATLGATEKTTELVRDLPFAARTSVLVFDLKLVLMLVVFVYAFFRFTWSMRQYTFGALLIGSAPEAKQFDALGDGAQAARLAFSQKAGRVLGLAAETFNDGLRAYYFAFAAIGWFFSPIVYVLATLGVIYILYQREFRSDVLQGLNA